MKICLQKPKTICNDFIDVVQYI